MKLHKRPTRNGLWHPVVNGNVQWPVEVDIHVVKDDDGKPTGQRIISAYTFGTEERREIGGEYGGDYRNALWLRYRDPKLPKGGAA